MSPLLSYQNYDHQNDGSTQQLAGCLRDFRNKPFPVKVKIEYFNNVLTVLFHNGMSNNERDFEVCMRVENVFLPKAGHFGISAATGGLAGQCKAVWCYFTQRNEWQIKLSPSYPST